VSFIEPGIAEEIIVWGEDNRFGFGNVEFELLLEHPNGDV
jgi:hypothetical protein